MKSDLLGPKKLTMYDIKTATAYIDKKRGVVILTDVKQPNYGTVIHAANPHFKIGQTFRFTVGFKTFRTIKLDLELLRGVVVLEND